MQDPIYTHLCRSTDATGKRQTTWHTSLAAAVAEQKAREEAAHFHAIIMPVEATTMMLESSGESVAMYRAAVEPTRKAVAAPRHAPARIGTRKAVPA